METTLKVLDPPMTAGGAAQSPGDLINRARKGRVLLAYTQAAVRAGTDRLVEVALRDPKASGPSGLARLAGESPDGDFRSSAGSLPEEAVRWVEAGDLFEKVASAAEKGARFDYAFCLDPWAACILSRLGNLLEGVAWIFVSDLKGRSKEDKAFWDSMEFWISTLRFHHIVPVEALIREAQGAAGAPSLENPSCREGGPGAHEETTGLTPAQSAETDPTNPYTGHRIQILPASSLGKPLTLKVSILLQHYGGGGSSYTRVFLDSLIRQKMPPEEIEVWVSTPEVAGDLAEYLRIFALAHPRPAIRPFDPGRSEGIPFRAPVVAVSDAGVILPETLLDEVSRDAGKDGIRHIPHVLIGREVAAHILTGNLDPVAHYEALRKAHVEARPEGRLADDPPRFLFGPRDLAGDLLARISQPSASSSSGLDPRSDAARPPSRPPDRLGDLVILGLPIL